MRIQPIGLRMLAAVALAAAIGIAHPALAQSGALEQSDDDLAALDRHVAQLREAGKYAEAIPLARRYAEAMVARHGAQHPEYARALNDLALLLRAANRPAEAEPLYARALDLMEKDVGPEHPKVARILNTLAQLLQATNRLAEAEPLMRRALAIDEKSLGAEHPDVARDLSNLAGLLQDTNRLTEAEPLMRRALTMGEKSLGPEHPTIGTRLNNLAQLLRDTNRPAEAEPLFRRALAISEKSLGPEHPTVATRLNNLAGLLQATNRLAEAEPLYRRALAIDEKSLGPEHAMVGIRLNNLAQVLRATDRPTEAEPLYRRALAIDEKSLGPSHPYVGIELNNLAQLRAELGDWAEATQLYRRARPIMTSVGGEENSNLVKATLMRNAGNLRAAARAVRRAGGDSADAREEGFELAQWALQTGAADALAQMAVRFAKGDGPLAGVVRERQDLIARRQSEDKLLLAAIGKADAKAAVLIRAAIADLDVRLDAIDKRMAAQFPEFARLANPKPLAITAVQGLLREDEALIAFLDVPRLGTLPEETLAWAVTKGQARWISIPLGTAALAERVARLRCGLDRGEWSQQRQRWVARGERCQVLKPAGLAADEPLPFDLGAAHELYAALLAPLADLTKGKRLIVVPSGPLTSLPFHVLVTEAPKAPTFRDAAWLALSQAITVLPSVGSLQALRKLPPTRAGEPYIGFGNPLLDGGEPEGEDARLARANQSCSLDRNVLRQRVAAVKGVLGLGPHSRGGINLAALRAQPPLPETADELCAVAKALGASGREADTVWLGARATEANLKALSRAGRLARYRVLHFATHGVLAGESEAILKAKPEPGLILTPPKDGATAADLEEDDGLLTASEVAQLNLDADWVVLSACNTAAGEKGDAEALSGLARAFFYAKARALLVSHWAVGSEAAVKLSTGAFEALRSDPQIGRAEALRRSMVRLIAARGDEAHPEYWAPFVLVGEGAGQDAR